MIELQRKHWFLAFSLALGVHLAVFAFNLGQPRRAPVYRSGSFHHEKDTSTRGGSSVFVKLGNAGARVGDNSGKPVTRKEETSTGSNEVPSQGSIEDREAREDGGNNAAVAVESQAVNDKDKAPKADPKVPANEPEPKAAATGQPKPPKNLPELESLTRRLSVQGPLAALDAKPEPSEKRQGREIGEATIERAATAFSEPGRAGTASGDKHGDVRKLNYEDRVLLWIKSRGGYPREALMFNLEDSVTVHFAIGPNGKILYHYLTKSSQYHLLNKAVERMMARSSPVPPFPPEIRNDKLTFTVTVHFDPYYDG